MKIDTLEGELQKKEANPATWLLDGGRARPAGEIAAGPELDSRPAPVQPSVAVGKNSMMRRPPEDRQVVAQPSAALEPRNKPVDGRQAQAAKYVAPGEESSFVAGRPAQNGEVDRVMAGFQRLMNNFLETQRNVMLAYLQGANGLSEEPNGQPQASTGAEPLPAIAGGAESDASNLIPKDGHVGHALAEPQLDFSERDRVARRLVEIVSERTGYPPDALDINVNLEADLGIDSIKHVEIIALLQQSFAPDLQQQMQERMDLLVRTKTLRGILDLLENLGDRSEENQPGSTGDHLRTADGVVAESQESAGIPRFILTPVRASSGGSDDSSAPDSVLLITDDERGIASALAETLERRGCRPVIARWSKSVSRLSHNLYTADLTDPEQARSLLDLIRQQEGAVDAIVHLLPLSEHQLPLCEVPELQEMDLADFEARARLEVHSLFNLARAAAGDLRQLRKNRKSRLVAATSMGSGFGVNVKDQAPASAISAGVGGFIKTIALEWPDVVCRAAHLDLNDSSANLVSQLLREINAEGLEPEIFYRNGGRYTIRPSREPLPGRASNDLMIESNSVILVTGGARGITAATAIDLARRYQPTLILVGRSPLPPRQEPADTVGLSAAQDIKAALIEQLRKSGGDFTLSQVESRYARLIQDREIRGTLTAIQQAGARVEYHQVDVRDGNAFAQFIRDVYQTHGRIDGVIHGAGIIEDKLIEDKAPDSFDRVFGAKVSGAFVLLRNLRRDVRFLVFYSSVAGAFGSRGQADYSAANEVLNKLAIYLDACWPGRVIAINWGPWEGRGMVSEEARKQFAERGVRMITPEAGARAFDEEIRFGRKGEVEVVLGNGPWAGLTAKSSARNETQGLLMA